MVGYQITWLKCSILPFFIYWGYTEHTCHIYVLYIQYVYLNLCRTLPCYPQWMVILRVNLIQGQNFLNYSLHYIFYHQYYNCFNVKVRYSGVWWISPYSYLWWLDRMEISMVILYYMLFQLLSICRPRNLVLHTLYLHRHDM